jgi:hypothetical protein
MALRERAEPQGRQADVDDEAAEHAHVRLGEKPEAHRQKTQRDDQVDRSGDSPYLPHFGVALVVRNGKWVSPFRELTH